MHGAEAANVVRLVPLASVLIVGAVASRRRLSEMAVQFGATLMVLVVTLYGYRFEQRRADQGRRSVSGSVWISCGPRTASTPPNGTTRGAFVRIDRVVIGPIAVDNVAARVNEGDLGSSLLGISLPERLGGVEIRNDTLTSRR